MKTMTLNLKGLGFSFKDFWEEIKKSWRIILLFLLFQCGMISGSLFFQNSAEITKNYFEIKCDEILEYSFTKLIIISICIYMIPLIISFISSFSAIGMPVIIMLPVIIGFVVSNICSFLYSSYRIDGVIFTILLIFPSAIINTLLFLIGCNESLILSGIITRNIFSVSKEGRGDLRLFFLRYIIIAAITIVTAAICAFSIGSVGNKLLV